MVDFITGLVEVNNILTLVDIDRRYNNKQKYYNNMNNQYPHICIDCQKPLWYQHILHEYIEKENLLYCNHYVGDYYKEKFKKEDVISLLNKGKKYIKLKKLFHSIWKAECIEFLCCKCYDDFKDVYEFDELFF